MQIIVIIIQIINKTNIKNKIKIHKKLNHKIILTNNNNYGKMKVFKLQILVIHNLVQKIIIIINNTKNHNKKME